MPTSFLGGSEQRSGRGGHLLAFHRKAMKCEICFVQNPKQPKIIKDLFSSTFYRFLIALQICVWPNHVWKLPNSSILPSDNEGEWGHRCSLQGPGAPAFIFLGDIGGRYIRREKKRGCGIHSFLVVSGSRFRVLGTFLIWESHNRKMRHYT